MHSLGAVFLGYALLSISWSVGNRVWLTIELCSFAIAYIIGMKLQNHKLVWIAFAAILTSDVTGFAILWVISDETFHRMMLAFNPNYLGCALAIAIAGAIVYRLYWFIPFGVLGLCLCLSRGAAMTAGIIGTIALFRSKYKATALILPAIAVIVVFTQRETEGTSLLSRMGVWQDTINHMTLFGHGFGSFMTEYAAFPIRSNMTLLLAPHAYNDFLELIFELGIGSIPLWLMLVVSIESRADGRLIIGAFCLLSLTYFPLSVPIVGQLFALTLGGLSQGVRYEVPSEIPAPYRGSTVGAGN